MALDLAADIAISIHAPVKGATRMTESESVALPLISIHAPVKGATAVRQIQNDLITL